MCSKKIRLSNVQWFEIAHKSPLKNHTTKTCSQDTNKKIRPFSETEDNQEGIFFLFFEMFSHTLSKELT